MSQTELQQTMSKHRSSMIVGGLIGLVLIAALIGWRVYEVMMVLEPPNVQTSSTADVIAFVSHKHGLAEMPQIEQEQFLQKWQEHAMQAEHKEELKKSLTMLDEQQTKSFVKQILRNIKDRYLRDAQKLASFGREDPKRFAFLREKVAQYDTEGKFIKEVSTCLKSTKVEFTQAKVQEWIIQHTTPEERIIGESYFKALESESKNMQKRRIGLEAAENDRGEDAKPDSEETAAPPTTQPGE